MVVVCARSLFRMGRFDVCLCAFACVHTFMWRSARRSDMTAAKGIEGCTNGNRRLAAVLTCDCSKRPRVVSVNIPARVGVGRCELPRRTHARSASDTCLVTTDCLRAKRRSHSTCCALSTSRRVRPHGAPCCSACHARRARDVCVRIVAERCVYIRVCVDVDARCICVRLEMWGVWRTAVSCACHVRLCMCVCVCLCVSPRQVHGTPWEDRWRSCAAASGSSRQLAAPCSSAPLSRCAALSAGSQLAPRRSVRAPLVFAAAAAVNYHRGRPRGGRTHG